MLLVDWKIFKSWPSSLRYIKVSKCMQNLMNETVMVKLLYSYGVLLVQLESHQLEMNSSMWSNEKDYFHFNFFPTWPRVSPIWRNAPQLQCLRTDRRGWQGPSSLRQIWKAVPCQSRCSPRWASCLQQLHQRKEYGSVYSATFPRISFHPPANFVLHASWIRQCTFFSSWTYFSWFVVYYSWTHLNFWYRQHPAMAGSTLCTVFISAHSSHSSLL